LPPQVTPFSFSGKDPAATPAHPQLSKVSLLAIGELLIFQVNTKTRVSVEFECAARTVRLSLNYFKLLNRLLPLKQMAQSSLKPMQDKQKSPIARAFAL